MKKTSKIESIFNKNQGLRSLLEASKQHENLHKLISSCVSQYIDFHILFEKETLTIKVNNANDWHLIHFAQNQIKRTLNEAGFNIMTITVSKSFSKI